MEFARGRAPGCPLAFGVGRFDRRKAPASPFRRLALLTLHPHTFKSVGMQCRAKIRTLSPTLWRTCRALANRRRLQLLQLVMKKPGVSVTSAARELRLPLTITSLYLRSLNARGLLRVVRKGKWVSYIAGPDPSVPETAILLKSLGKSLRKGPRSLDRVFHVLTAFTHPRRMALIRAVGGGADHLQAIRMETGISSSAALRHLDKLCRRGFLVRGGGRYRCLSPEDPLARALSTLALCWK